MNAFNIRRLTPAELDAAMAIGHLLDDPPREAATRRFLDSESNHLLVAYVDGQPAGFITGVELTHPDKGTEMFIYELGVDEAHRRRGIGRALTEALMDIARKRGCYGMWVATEPDNAAALGTYRSAGAGSGESAIVLVWSLPDAEPT